MDIAQKPFSVLVAFEDPASISAWQSIGDPIMGGQSEGVVTLSDEGWGKFYGTVRRDNGGGFASVKLDLSHPVDASSYEGIELLAWGDGRTYKIGLRNGVNRNRVVYQQPFTPETEKWTRIRLPFNEFLPTWRGQLVPDAEPLDPGQIASLSVFVSGGQFGDFHLRMQNWFLY